MLKTIVNVQKSCQYEAFFIPERFEYNAPSDVPARQRMFLQTWAFSCITRYSRVIRCLLTDHPKLSGLGHRTFLVSQVQLSWMLLAQAFWKLLTHKV